MASGWIATVSAIGAALLGVALGALLSHRSQMSQRSRELQISAYTELLSSFASSVSLVRAKVIAGSRPDVDWSDWNRSLAVVTLTADSTVATAAVNLDEAMWRMHKQATRERLDDAAWRQLREPLERSRLNFINIVRKELGAAGLPLTRAQGRPVHADPVWKIVQKPMI